MVFCFHYGVVSAQVERETVAKDQNPPEHID